MTLTLAENALVAKQVADLRTKFRSSRLVSLNEAGHPIHARITAVSGFSSEAIADWAKRHLSPGSQVLSDGLACFRAVTISQLPPQGSHHRRQTP